MAKGRNRRSISPCVSMSGPAVPSRPVHTPLQILTPTTATAGGINYLELRPHTNRHKGSSPVPLGNSFATNHCDREENALRMTIFRLYRATPQSVPAASPLQTCNTSQFFSNRTLFFPRHRIRATHFAEKHRRKGRGCNRCQLSL